LTVAVDGLTFPALLARNRAAHAGKVVVAEAGSSITHGALDDSSRALAGRLAAAGVTKGSRVGLLEPNGIGWAVSAAAVLRIGGVLVPLSTLLRPPELEAQLRVAGVTHLVVAREFRGRRYGEDLDAVAPDLVERVEGGGRHPDLPDLRAIWFGSEEVPPQTAGDEVVAGLEGTVRPADDLAILFTSGSRGVAKGVIHTHGGGLRAVAAGLEARRVGPDDRLYIPMPFFWTGGFSTGLLSVLVAGATLLTEAVPEPDATLDLLERERVTLFRGWPDQAARLAAHPRFGSVDLSGLRPGSLPAVLPTAERPAPGARANLFGMTETFGPYCGARLDLDLPSGTWGSCGRPFDGFEVRIVDPVSGRPCEAGVVGEIRVGGPNIMRGICGRTRDATFDAEGYYPTGDLGAVDAGGYLWFHGRLDDMFKVKGATVYPAEVEAAVRAVPGVQQAHATNVGDEVGVLVVTAAPLEDLVAGARARLSAFKVPTCWVLTGSADDVPMLATAKVDKVALQALLQREGRRCR
jgi:acyl-CoA synthetase (AMP-forming)/AMP-acid ligase II